MNRIEHVVKAAGPEPDAYWARRLLEVRAFTDENRNAALLTQVLNTDPSLLLDSDVGGLWPMEVSGWSPSSIEQVIRGLTLADAAVRAAVAGMLWAEIAMPPSDHKHIAQGHAVSLLREALKGGATNEAVVSRAIGLFGSLPDTHTLAEGLRLLSSQKPEARQYQVIALMAAAFALRDHDTYLVLRTAFDDARTAYRSPDCEARVANFDGAFALIHGSADDVADAVARLTRFSKNVPYLDGAEGLVFVEGLVAARLHLESCLEYLAAIAPEFQTPKIVALIDEIHTAVGKTIH